MNLYECKVKYPKVSESGIERVVVEDCLTEAVNVNESKIVECFIKSLS